MRQEIEHVNSDVLCVGKCWHRFVISLNVCVFRLGLKSFEKDVSGAVMDIQADEEEGMRQSKSLKKWYKKPASLSTSFQGSLSLSFFSLKETSKANRGKRQRKPGNEVDSLPREFSDDVTATMLASQNLKQRPCCVPNQICGS